MLQANMIHTLTAMKAQVSLELGRQIVYGAIGYARGLGFEPHADFGQAAGYLGTWDGECELTFGLDGKPMYICGPHDNAEKIIRKLSGLGEGNYHTSHTPSQADRSLGLLGRNG